MRILRTLLAAIGCCLMLALSACKNGPGTTTPRGYFDKTDPIEKVIADINRNNSKLPTLWAHQHFEATIAQKGKSSQFVNGDGALMYGGGNMVYLSAKKEVGKIFDMGCNADQFWLHLYPQEETFWWGNIKNIDKPCMQDIPIRPDEILEVLGIRTISTALLQEPVPVMRFNNDADAYAIVWQTQYPANDPERWVARREIWYDRQTKRPTNVLLFDVTGRVVLRAYLSEYETVKVENILEADQPTMATLFKLFFPDTGSHMWFKLSDLTLTRNGFPKPANFRMPNPADVAASGAKVIQIDEDCGS